MPVIWNLGKFHVVLRNRVKRGRLKWIAILGNIGFKLSSYQCFKFYLHCLSGDMTSFDHKAVILSFTFHRKTQKLNRSQSVFVHNVLLPSMEHVQSRSMSLYMDELGLAEKAGHFRNLK